jgi:cytochrome d ubiquinol oxidase subunit II
MFGNLAHTQLQELWWIVVSLVGSLFVFMTFVQGGQSLLGTIAKTDRQKSLVINSLGRKWELTYTTLVLFGGAFFAAFPKFYATSFGGAYWVWIAILFTFSLQAVSYEFRKKDGNLLGARVYETFLFINGAIGILLVGAAVGTFFTGSHFQVNAFNLSSWKHPLRGLEAALVPFNLAMGLVLVFLSRALGAMYLVNNIRHAKIEEKARSAAFRNFLYLVPFLLYILYSLLTMQGFALDPATGTISLEKGKYFVNLMAMPIVMLLLITGILLIAGAAVITGYTSKRLGIWLAGPGTVFTCLSIFFLAGFNNTAFYPSIFDLQSSLTIYNASSSHYTLTAMSYIALAVPFVLAYIAWVWKLMDAKKLDASEFDGETANDLY